MVSKFACDLGNILKSSTQEFASLVLNVEPTLKSWLCTLLKAKESSFECVGLSLIHRLTPTKRSPWTDIMVVSYAPERGGRSPTNCTVLLWFLTNNDSYDRHVRGHNSRPWCPFTVIFWLVSVYASRRVQHTKNYSLWTSRSCTITTSVQILRLTQG